MSSRGAGLTLSVLLLGGVIWCVVREGVSLTPGSTSSSRDADGGDLPFDDPRAVIPTLPPELERSQSDAPSTAPAPSLSTQREHELRIVVVDSQYRDPVVGACVRVCVLDPDGTFPNNPQPGGKRSQPALGVPASFFASLRGGDEENRLAAEALTDSQGASTFLRDWSQAVILECSHAGYATTYRLAGGTETSTKTRGITVVLDRAIEIRGTVAVQGDRGAGATRFDIGFGDPKTRRFWVTSTGADGSFWSRIGSSAPVPFSLTPGWSFVESGPLDIGGSPGQNDAVADVGVLWISAQPQLVVHDARDGRLVDEFRLDLVDSTNHNVLLSDQRSSGPLILGEFERSRSVRMYVTAPQYGQWERSFPEGLGRAGVITARLEVGEVSGIRGSVRRSSRAVPGCTILARMRSPFSDHWQGVREFGATHETKSDELGEFVLVARPGIYDVVALDQGVAVARVCECPVEDLSIEIAAPGRLEATLDPACLHATGGNRVIAVHRETKQSHVQTIEENVAMFDDLAPGSYRLHLANMHEAGWRQRLSRLWVWEVEVWTDCTTSLLLEPPDLWTRSVRAVFELDASSTGGLDQYLRIEGSRGWKLDVQPERVFDVPPDQRGRPWQVKCQEIAWLCSGPTEAGTRSIVLPGRQGEAIMVDSATQQPLAGVAVEIQEWPGVSTRALYRVTSDSNGAVPLLGTPNGVVRLRLEDPQYNGQTFRLPSNADSTEIEVGPFAMDSWVQATGRVWFGAEDNVTAFVHVRAIWSRPDAVTRARCDESGAIADSGGFFSVPVVLGAEHYEADVTLTRDQEVVLRRVVPVVPVGSGEALHFEVRL